MLLKIFLGVAWLFENKGLSCLVFPKFQPLTKSVAYIALLIKGNKCKAEFEDLKIEKKIARKKQM